MEAEQAASEHIIAMEGACCVDLHQSQKLCCGEKPLKREEDRVRVLKSCRIHLSEKTSQSKEAGKDFPTCSCLLKHQVAHSGGEPPRSTESGEALHTGKSHYKCSECGKAFSQKYLFSMRGCTLEKSLMNAVNVANYLAISLTFLYTK